MPSSGRRTRSAEPAEPSRDPSHPRDPRRAGTLGPVTERFERRPLTGAQQDRRQRILDAAAGLAMAGGYDAVQMRDVAARADVALGTLYRYFSSKDHLLSAVLVWWMEQLQDVLDARPPDGSSAADRVMVLIERVLSVIEEEPSLITALFASVSSADPAAVACQQDVAGLMERLLALAVGHEPSEDLAQRARIIGHVWYSVLVGWVNGWRPLDDVRSELADAVRLLLCDVVPGALLDRSNERCGATIGSQRP